MYKNNPEISVIIPTYNRADFLSKAIKSVLNQKFQNLELIIVDDGSTDNTKEIVNEFQKKDKRVKYIWQKNSGGPAEPKNTGIKNSESDFLAFLDSDDEWLDKDKLKKQKDFLEKNSDYGLVGTNALVMDEKEKIVGKLIHSGKDELIRRKILIKNQFIHSSVMFRKEITERVGLYKKEKKYVEDYDLWLRIGQYYKFANLPFYGLKYRLNPYGETATKNRQQVVNSFKLTIKFKTKYPNFVLACLKWTLRYFETFFIFNTRGI